MKEAKNFWLYSLGMFVSFTGSGVQDIALPLFILDVTGSGKAMGTFMILSVAPRLVLYPLAGVVGDRINRKWIMVWMDFGRGVVILFLAFLATKNLITIPLLFTAQFIISIMNALFGPATIAMLPDIVKRDDLMRANSVVEIISNLSYIMGPILGGIIYGLGGIKTAFLVNALSFIGSGVSELFIKYQQETKKFSKVCEVITDLKEGVLFIRTHRGLLIFLGFGVMLNFLSGPLFVVLIPYVLRIVIRFSSEQFGMLQTSYIAGILIGNLLIGALLAESKIENMIKRGLIVQTILKFVFVVLIFPPIIEFLGHGSWTIFCAIFLTFMFMGIFNAFVNTPVDVGFQKMIPTEFRARVFSVAGVISQGIVPIGYGIMGIALDVVLAHDIALVVSIMLSFVVSIYVLKYLKEACKGLEG